MILKDDTSLIDRISDERLFSIASLLQAIASVFVLLAIVVVWDTLPSLTPITDVRITPVTGQHSVILTYDYKMQKMVDFKLHYTVTHQESQQSIHDQSQVSSMASQHIKHFNLTMPGTWCTSTVVEWNNGLSLRPHSRELSPVCFDI